MTVTVAPPMAEDGPRHLAINEAIDALTRALLPTSGADRVDGAALIAGVLASAAANLGGVSCLTSGRPGSWEADLVHQLVAGTVGHDDEYLWEHRTWPVVVPLNLRELPYEIERFPSLDAALGEVDARHDGLPDGRYDVDAHQAELEAVTDSYAATYAAYAQAFAAAVTAAAAALAGLPVTVTVDALHDPRAADRPDLQHPRPYVGDCLVARLWWSAADTVPIPAVPSVAT